MYVDRTYMERSSQNPLIIIKKNKKNEIQKYNICRMSRYIGI